MYFAHGTPLYILYIIDLDNIKFSEKNQKNRLKLNYFIKKQKRKKRKKG